jgi:hypothetical protein
MKRGGRSYIAEMRKVTPHLTSPLRGEEKTGSLFLPSPFGGEGEGEGEAAWR